MPVTGAFVPMGYGAVTITEEWVPEPVVVAEGYDKIADALNNMRPPLLLCERVFIQHVSEKFDSAGPGWAPWGELS